MDVRTTPLRALVRCALVGLALALVGCVRIPAGVEPVADFDSERYLGRWYEIARLDHSFERGLSRVTAQYGARDDGGVSVVNRGFNADANGGQGEWDSVTGRAYFVEGADLAYLKVSFFGPFYGAYIVFDLDADYRHALVSGPNRDFLWLLARSPEPAPEVVAALVARAAAAGFATEELIFVDHSNP